MSGIETLLASAYAGLTTAGSAAGAAAGTTAATAAGTAAGVGAATGTLTAGLASAGEIALIKAAEASAALGTGAAASSGVSTIGALSSAATLAGAGAQLLTKTPSIDLPKPVTRDEARAEADRRAVMLKRRGRAATLLTGPQGVASSPTLGAPSLMGVG